MAALLPPNMTNSAMVGTNSTRDESSKPAKQSAKRPHQGTNESAKYQCLDQTEQPTLKLDVLA